MSSSKLWSYETLSHAVAGAAGGVTAMTMFYPLDTVRSRLQVEDNRQAKNTFSVMKDLTETEGLPCLYRGLQPVLGSLCCSNFVYFYAFHGLRSLVRSENRGRKAARDLLMSSIAGIINVLVTTPLWVANSRIKMQGAMLSAEDKAELKKHPRYNGLIDAIIKIYKEEGVQALWSSLVPSIMLVCNPAIQFTVYEALKAEVMKAVGKRELNAAQYFILGAISKSISTFLTYPLQLVQSKLRYGSDKLKTMNIIEVFLYIIRLHGFAGLYKGLEAKLLQTVSTAALMFLCYEKIIGFVLHIMKTKRA